MKAFKDINVGVDFPRRRTSHSSIASTVAYYSWIPLVDWFSHLEEVLDETD